MGNKIKLVMDIKIESPMHETTKDLESAGIKIEEINKEMKENQLESIKDLAVDLGCDIDDIKYFKAEFVEIKN